MADRGQPGGGRHLKVRVKTAKRRAASSTRWLERQLNDPYVARAKAEGYRARSAYKLIEIDDRYKFLAPGKRVVAVDYLDMDPLPGVTVVKKDILDADAPEAIRVALGGEPADIVLSDMAAPTTGHRQTDHLRTEHLSEAAAEFAMEVLRPGGHFLTKVFQGGSEGELLALLKRRFRSVHHVKPPASRAASVELYLVAKDLRPQG